jgi:DNA-binding response OmpR family regulator
MTDLPGRKPVALVVDDEPDQRVLVRRRIEASCEVIEASTSGEALRIILSRPVDIVLTDSNLPNFDGKELCRQLRTTHGYRGAIVFVSASADHPAVEMEMIDAGADGILGKPFKGDHLRALVEDVAGLLSDRDRAPTNVSRKRRTLGRRVTRLMRGLQTSLGGKPPTEDDPPSD